MDLDRYCARDCGRHTVVMWALFHDDDQPDRDWYLCGPCSDRDAETLVMQGWTQISDRRETVTVEAAQPSHQPDAPQPQP